MVIMAIAGYHFGGTPSCKIFLVAIDFGPQRYFYDVPLFCWQAELMPILVTPTLHDDIVYELSAWALTGVR